jgi:hypothetical protein
MSALNHRPLISNVFKLDEFFSRTDLEKMVNNPPQDELSIRRIVDRFEQMDGCITPSGEDLLEAFLLNRHVALILLGHLRLAADRRCKTTTRRMIQKQGLFAPLANGFQYSNCNFAKAIFRREE